MIDTASSVRMTPRALAARVLPQPVKRLLKEFGPIRRATKTAHHPGALAGGTSATSYIPTDHARQVHSHYYIEEAMTAPDAPELVVDLGCGDGASTQLFRQWQPDVQWIGVDVEQSDLARAITGEKVVLYDGVNLPFPDNSVPLIYTNQVFEHVRYPEPLLREICRVLTPGGVFIGSTSQLEPYHAWSLWGGYTLYGWRILCAAAGLVLEEARPSIDAIALITRQYEGAQPHHNLGWQLSPLNAEIDTWAAETGADVAATNARKLQFCGQFAYRVRKPQGGPAAQARGAKIRGAKIRGVRGVAAPTRSNSPLARARRQVGTVLVRAGLSLSR